MDVDMSVSIGQQQARTRWGTHESGAAFDHKKSISLSQQARAYIEQQAFCVMAGRGPRHEPDAQLVMEKPGFVELVDRQTCLLHLNDRLNTSLLFQGLQQATAAGFSDQVGLFFICHPTRERLSVHGKAQLLAGKKLVPFWPFTQGKSLRVRLDVQQAFFHCAKYIRTQVVGLTAPVTPSSGQSWHPQHLERLRAESLGTTTASSLVCPVQGAFEGDVFDAVSSVGGSLRCKD